MGGMRKKGEYTDLPFECLKRMQNQGWKIAERIVNEIGHPASDSGMWEEKQKKDRLVLHRHIDIIVGRKL